MNNVDFAIIGGTGAFTGGKQGERLNNRERMEISTKYGKVILEIIEVGGTRVALLKRHGLNHSIPPHRINYRANIMALKMLGIKRILATAAVGSLNRKFKPGDLVLLSDFIDFTWGRDTTFFDEAGQEVIHVDMTNPYCLFLRGKLIDAAQDTGISLISKGATYVCTQGPRFETPAEILMYKHLGADLVGMTSVPEVVLAREAEICYATAAIVTNYAAGISDNPLTHQEVLERMAMSSAKIYTLFSKAIKITDSNKLCSCQTAVSGQESLGG